MYLFILFKRTEAPPSWDIPPSVLKVKSKLSQHSSLCSDCPGTGEQWKHASAREGMFLSVNQWCRQSQAQLYFDSFISITIPLNILGEKKVLFLLFSAHHKTVALSRLNRKDIHNISLTCRGQLFNCHNWHPLCCGHWSVRGEEVISTKFLDILYSIYRFCWLPYDQNYET